MKLTKLLAGLVAAATAVAALTAGVSAYKFEFDDGFEKKDGAPLNWTDGRTVPGTEFEGLTADKYVKLTFEADQNEKEYWSIKPLYIAEDESWQFLDPDGVGGPFLAPAKDAYPVLKDWTDIYFKVPAGVIDAIKENGMIFLGHSVTLKTLELVDEAPPAKDPNASNEDETTADESKPEESKPADSNNSGNDTPKDPANTGIEGVAVLMGVGILAGTAVVISKKRK